MIRVDPLFVAVDPTDMRVGIDSILSRVVAKFGSTRPHTAYCFINSNRSLIKVLVHDGFGLWLAVRRLHKGRFIWAEACALGGLQISAEWVMETATTEAQDMDLVRACCTTQAMTLTTVF